MHKKHLGQHYLHDPKLINKIIDQSPFRPESFAGQAPLVLEIGPGQGTMTAPMLQRGFRVVTVEYDAELIPVLQQKFAAEIATGQLQLVQGDILKLDIQSVQSPKSLERGNTQIEFNPSSKFSGLSSSYHIIANIPYYITGAILQKFLTADHQPHSMTLIMQREVADRIMAYDEQGNPGRGKHSLLSLSVWLYGIPSRPFIIPAGAFTPPPQVDSATLVISDISRHNFDTTESEVLFFKLIHAGFGQKRKQLKKLLAELVPGNVFVHWCESQGYPVTIRAEDVSLTGWLELIRMLPTTIN